MFDDKDAFITFDLGEMFRLHAFHIKAPSHGAPRFITVEVYESLEVYNAHWSRDTYRFETNINEKICGMQRYTINGVEGMAYGRIVRVHLSHASGTRHIFKKCVFFEFQPMEFQFSFRTRYASGSVRRQTKSYE